MRNEKTQRNRWLRYLQLFVVLNLFGTSAALARHNPWWRSVSEWWRSPNVTWTGNVTPNPDDGDSHYEFNFIWYNFDGDNAWYDTSTEVWLKVDDEEVVPLSSSMHESLYDWRCQMFTGSRNEDDADRLCNHDGEVLFSEFHSEKVGTGSVSITNPFRGDEKSYQAHCTVVLDNLRNGTTHTVQIYGKWAHKGGKREMLGPKITINSPKCSFPSNSGKFVSVGNRKVKHSIEGLNPQFGKSDPWHYSLVDYKASPGDETTYGDDLCYGNGTLPDNVQSGSTEINILSNYEPTVVYPRVRRYRSYEWKPSGGEKHNSLVSYFKDYEPITIPGFVRPTNLQIQPEQWSRNVKLTWEREGKEGAISTGKWVIFRMSPDSTFVNLGSVAGGTMTFTHKDINEPNAYDVEYRYYVCFLPAAWNVLDVTELRHPDEMADLYASKAVTITRDFSMAFEKEGDKKCVGKDKSIFLKWNYNPSFADASASNQYEVKLMRSVNGANATELQKFVVNNGKVTSHEFEDNDIGSCYNTQSYYLEVEAMDTIWTSSAVQLSTTGMSKVTKVEATRGNHTGMVKLYWNAVQMGRDVTYYEVFRRPLGSTDEDDYAKIYSTSGTATSYSYDDNSAQAGEYYEYKVSSFVDLTGITADRDADDERSTSDPISVTCDGFSLSTGVLSGRVSFGTGTAVDSVRVSLVSDGSDVAQQSRSMYFHSQGSGVVYENSSDVNKLFEGKSFAVQMYLNPSDTMKVAGQYPIFRIPGTLSLSLSDYDRDTKTFALYLDGSPVALDVPANVFSNLTLSYDRNRRRATLTLIDNADRVSEASVTKNITLGGETDRFVLGGELSEGSPYYYHGYIDEFRLFSGQTLERKNIMANYNHTLSGTEAGLSVYWPFDEGVNGQMRAYDYSKKSGVLNGRHGRIQSNTENSTVVPSRNQLGLMALTDSLGNYVIRGVPFTAEGTNYIVAPTKGVHEFTPSSSTRVVSANSLVHSAVDFTDVSSFPVSGFMYYENTTYPVEGATISVDGTVCTRDGDIIYTDKNGHFEVDVPIGKHYLTASKEGHTFAYNGRFPNPADYDGKSLYTFTQEMKDKITFYDNTLVPIVGRISAGPNEDEKPLGFGLSRNLVGQAKLTLTAGGSILNAETKVDGSSFEYVPASKERTFAIPSDTRNLTSKTVVGTGETGATQITILTDERTGEFAAMVPPLLYTVTGIETVNPTEEAIDWGNPTDIDATNVLVTTTDSTNIDGVDCLFEYVASFKRNHRTTPVMKVTQVGAEVEGAFGEYEYTYTDRYGQEQTIALYDKEGDFETIPVFDGSGSPYPDESPYRYEYPIFLEGSWYDFLIRVYESYKNADTGETVDVPLQGVTVDVEGSLGSGTQVLLEDYGDDEAGTVDTEDGGSVQLDEEGQAVYRWMAGLPNISEAGEYIRTLSMSYLTGVVNREWEGNGFAGKILGSLPGGTNFVTGGPDRVLMILRDPPGSNSSAYIEEGTTISTSHTAETSAIIDNNNEMVVSVGTTRQMITGAVTGGPVGSLVATSIELETESNVSSGLELTTSTTESGSTSVELSVKKRISTSAEPEYVGATGDVFIGTATNYSYGTGVQVYINEDGELTHREVIERSDVFGTEFQYSQYYVEHVLIPRYADMRNAAIKTVTNEEYLDENYPNPHETPIYISVLTPEDERFGSDNSDRALWGDDQAVSPTALMGPSYRMILPDSYRRNYESETRVFSDTIKWYNQQIEHWKNVLANNEDAKVKAIQNRADYLLTNLSFDTGAGIEMSTSKNITEATAYEDSFSSAISVGGGTNVDLFGSGTALSFSMVTTVATKDVYETTKQTTREMGFCLAESGDDDVLSVDVFTAPDGFGTIFYTAGGQTSCPYEDEIVAKYSSKYKGAVLSNKTQQIERPRIECVSNIVTGVPANKGATFNVLLYNDSETKEDCYFNLNIPDIQNQKGANVLMDGVSLNYGRTILVPAGVRMNKVVQVFQTDDNVTEFTDLPIRISSVCQPDNTSTFPEIADTVFVSAYFQPAVSDVSLECAQTAITLATGTTLNFTIKDFDYNYANLKNIKVQCKQVGAPQWKDCATWEKGKDDDVMKNGSISYAFDMSNSRTYPDGTWVFRAVTTSDIGEDYVYASGEITFVKDTNRPQLISVAQPSDGILDAGDEISLTFNEDIRNGQLTMADNFYVRGELNSADVDHDVALNLSNGQPAKTESRIDLANRSWAVNMWMNYTGGGHILTHGVTGNQFDLSVKDDGTLVATVNGHEYSAANKLPKDNWTFMSLSYDAESGSLSANCAYDAYEKVLFANETVGEYTGNGCLALGEGLTGQIHEVTLWDNARPWVEALSEKSVTKNRYTNGLMGYWRFNEGHGKSATDKSRSRTMTLPSATAWYINAENYYLDLKDGNKVTALNIAKTGTRSNDSYLLELWFRADQVQKESGAVSIVGLENDMLDLRLNGDGALEMLASGSVYPVSNADYRDGQWHHLALNVLKSTAGNATVYMDGMALKSVGASAVPALTASRLYLGSHCNSEGSTVYGQQLTGGIDEVRIWKQRCTAEVVRSNIYNRVDAKTPELVAYYPFEYATVGTNGQALLKKSAEDVSNSEAGEAEVLLGSASTFTDMGAVGLKPAPTKVNVAFDFVASERKILLTLAEAPELLEGCTVSLTVKGVKDMQDNTAEPVTWDVYVRQNQLRWSTDEISVRKEMANEASFSVDVVNTGGSNESWTLDNIPTWLKASAESGTLLPLSTKTITFTVDPATAPGRYEETMLLTGALGIAEPLVVNLVSAVEAPDWAVNAEDYEYNMDLVGRVQINGVYAENSEDVVGAFMGTKCVGVAHPTYFPRYDGYYVMMTVYGDWEDVGSDVTFKLFDASTGTVYPSVSVTQDGNPIGQNASTLVMPFEVDALYGALGNPVLFAPEQTIEQTLALRKGWTWTSLYVTPVNASLGAIFKDYPEVSYFKNKSAFSAAFGGVWNGDIAEAMPNQMYKIRSSQKTEVSVLGEPVDPKTTDVTIAKGWNWIGYNCAGTASLDVAFADLAPAEGDVVKNQSQFSIYTAGEWVGTLTMLTPGMGYLYQSMANATRTFRYPAVSNLNMMRAPALQRSTYINADYDSNMSIILQVKDGDTVLDGAQVAVYSEEELRGLSEREVMVDRGDDAEATHFLTVFGQGSGAPLYFIVTFDGQDYIIPTEERFRNDGILGSLEAPFVLNLDGTTGIQSINKDADETIYDLAGRRIQQLRQRGVYIVNGKKAAK